jgi:methyltransferase (TIGR00027 family)
VRDGPSLTAQRVAVSRAAHQILDHPPLLEDPIAARIVGTAAVEEIRAHPLRFSAPLARYLRAFVAARSRVAEDALAQSLGRGVRQYVILGAGLDTFAYRNPHPAALLRVFEVDHPATQAWKRQQLHAGGIALPEALSFVPVDFEADMLAERLTSNGWRADEPSFFSWLGVTMYLTREAVMRTLGYLASLPGGGGVVFDYAVPPASLSLMRRLIVGAVRRHVAALGEPWRTFFDSDGLSTELTALGFRQLADLGPDEINARFFRERSDGLRVGRVGRIVCASS